MLAFALPVSANAGTSEALETQREIAVAVNQQPGALETLSGTSGFPTSGSGTVHLGDGAGMRLPAVGGRTVINSTAIFTAKGTQDAQLALQKVEGGARALINIDGPNAPERFAFRLSGVSRLQLNGNGSVTAYGPRNIQIGGFAPPWARDASGVTIPTRYVVEGTTLVQYVEHRRAGVVYGVTADPVWLALGLKACLRLRCDRFMANKVRGQFLHGHITPAVKAFIRTWFCAKTFIC